MTDADVYKAAAVQVQLVGHVVTFFVVIMVQAFQFSFAAMLRAVVGAAFLHAAAGGLYGEAAVQEFFAAADAVARFADAGYDGAFEG